MMITHKKLPPMKCYHIFSDTIDVNLSKNHYGSYSPQMVPTNPPGSWPNSDIRKEVIAGSLQWLCRNNYSQERGGLVSNSRGLGSFIPMESATN